MIISVTEVTCYASCLTVESVASGIAISRALTQRIRPIEGMNYDVSAVLLPDHSCRERQSLWQVLRTADWSKDGYCIYF